MADIWEGLKSIPSSGNDLESGLMSLPASLNITTPEQATPGAGFGEEFIPSIFGKRGIPAQTAASFVSGVTEPISNIIGGGVGLLNKPAGKTVKEFLHIKPNVEEPVTFGEKVGQTVGGFGGFLADIALTKGLGKISAVRKIPVIGRSLGWFADLKPGLQQSIATGALWGAAEDTEYDPGTAQDIAARGSQALKTATLFSVLHGAGVGLDQIFRKVPGIKDTLNKLRPEQADLVKTMISQGTIGFGMGAMAPADTLGERGVSGAATGLGFMIGTAPFAAKQFKGAKDVLKTAGEAQIKASVETPVVEPIRPKAYPTKMSLEDFFKDPQQAQAKMSERVVEDKAGGLKVRAGEAIELPTDLGVTPADAEAVKALNESSFADIELKKRVRALERQMGRSIGVLSPDVRENILSQLRSQIAAEGGVQPQKFNSALQNMLRKGNLDMTNLRSVVFETRERTINGKKVYDFFGKKLTPRDIAELIDGNPELFPKGVNSLNVGRVIDSRGNFKVVESDKDAFVQQLRSEVGNELIDINKSKISEVVTAEPVLPKKEIVKAPEEKATIVAKEIIEKMKEPSKPSREELLKRQREAFEREDKQASEDAMRKFGIIHKPDLSTYRPLKKKIDFGIKAIKEPIRVEAEQPVVEESPFVAAKEAGRPAVEKLQKDLAKNIAEIKKSDIDIEGAIREAYKKVNMKFPEGVDLEKIVGELPAEVSVEAVRLLRDAEYLAPSQRLSAGEMYTHSMSIAKYLENKQAHIRMNEESAKSIQGNNKIKPNDKAEALRWLREHGKELYSPDYIDSSLQDTLSESIREKIPTLADLKPKFVTIKDLSAIVNKTGKEARIWINGKVWRYVEADGKGQLFDGDGERPMINIDPKSDLRFNILGEINDSTTYLSGGAAAASWGTPIDYRDIQSINDETSPAWKEHEIKKVVTVKVPGAWLFPERWVKGFQDYWKQVTDPKIIQRDYEITEKLEPISTALDIRNVKSISVSDELHKIMQTSGVTNIQLGRTLLKVGDVIVADVKNEGNPRVWAYGNKTKAQYYIDRGMDPAQAQIEASAQRDMVDMFRTRYPDMFDSLLKTKTKMDEVKFRYLSDADQDIQPWLQRKYDGYFHRQSTLSDDEIEQHWIRRSKVKSVTGSKEDYDRARDNDTFEQYEKASRDAGLEVNYDFAELAGRYISGAEFRLELKAAIKDLSNWEDPKLGHKMIEYAKPGLDSQDLRDLGYQDIGKEIRMFNTILPSGAEKTMWAHPEIAKEFRFLFEKSPMGNTMQAFRTFKQAVINRILWHAGFVMEDNMGGALAILGPRRLGAALIKGTGKGMFTGKVEMPKRGTPEERAEALRGGMVVDKEVIQRSLDVKFKQAANSFFAGKEVPKTLFDRLKKVEHEIFSEHLGTNTWMWGMLDNMAMDGWLRQVEIYQKKGFSRKEAGRIASDVVSTAFQSVPNRVQSDQVRKILGTVLISRSYTTAALRLLTGAFPMLEKVPSSKALGLRHAYTNPKARAAAARGFQKVLLSQMAGSIIVGNLVNLAFKGQLMSENEPGHRMDANMGPGPDGRDIYVNIPFFRQYESLVKMMPNFVGSAVGLEDETSTWKWVMNKTDPVLRTGLTLIANYNDATHETLRDPGATDVENILNSVGYAAGSLYPAAYPLSPQARYRTPQENIATALGMRATRGFPGGAEAKKYMKGIQQEEYRKEKLRKSLSKVEPGSAEEMEVLRKVYQSRQGLKTFFQRRTAPEQYYKRKYMSMMKGKREEE